MKQTYPSLLRTFLLIAAVAVFAGNSGAQSCTPLGNPATYGTGNSWIGYIYQGKNFNTYKGYINEGDAAAAFDESFGGSQTNFATNGCPVYTDTFSVRYRLTKNFAASNYAITVGGDDGYRLSLDGGATWAINSWSDHAYGTSTYNVYLSGSYNLVIEYYESFGSNRISFNAVTVCTGDGDPTVYGTNNIWNAYLYQGTNFDFYKGRANKGTATNATFDDNFGGGSTPVTVATSNCSIQTQTFSARYRLQKTLAAGTYLITVGGDDGYRFSIDGGTTWVINKWVDQSYAITTYTANLSGTYNFVIEYYQNTGYSRISFDMSMSSLLPVKLVSFAAAIVSTNKTQLTWTTAETSGFKNFLVQRSTDAVHFETIQTVAAQSSNSTTAQSYVALDNSTAAITYYRLAMVDADGTTSYSNVIRLQNTATASIKIYPSFVENNNLYVETGKLLTHAKAVIYDMNGRKLSEQTLENVQGRQAIVIGAAVRNGAYIVGVTDGTNLLAKQVVVIK